MSGTKAVVGNGLEASPKPGRKQLASSEECLPKVNGETLGDLEALKQDLLREVRKEINKAKLEIIEGMKMNDLFVTGRQYLTFLLGDNMISKI